MPSMAIACYLKKIIYRNHGKWFGRRRERLDKKEVPDPNSIFFRSSASLSFSSTVDSCSTFHCCRNSMKSISRYWMFAKWREKIWPVISVTFCVHCNNKARTIQKQVADTSRLISLFFYEEILLNISVTFNIFYTKKLFLSKGLDQAKFFFLIKGTLLSELWTR